MFIFVLGNGRNLLFTMYHLLFIKTVRHLIAMFDMRSYNTKLFLCNIFLLSIKTIFLVTGYSIVL